MKKLIVTVAAAALLAPGLASAQSFHGPHGWGGSRASGQSPAAQAGAPPAPAPQRDSGRSGARDFGGRGDRGFAGRGSSGGHDWRGRGEADRTRTDRGQNDRAQNDRGQNDRGQNNRGRNDRDRSGFGAGARSFQGGRGFDGRDRDGRFDNARRYDDGRRFDNRGGFGRNDNRYSRNYGRFRVSPYRWPGGYRYAATWRAHQFLPSSFLLREYYIDNYWDYGFAAPPYGYEWIRVGEDALLVDIYTGEIVEVAPGVFYW